jgi:hypothetical protein
MAVIRPNRLTLVTVGSVLLVTLLLGTSTVRAALDRISRFLSLHGEPEPASANVLSEHEVETLASMPPQAQAELLLERSINHYAGANEQIAARVSGWRGNVTLDERLNNLFQTAINSDDLRVRAAGIEVDIAARNLDKSSSTVDRLEPAARAGEQGPRANALWDIALLGNRGIDPERAVQILLGSIHDDNVNVRYWAVEGLAYLGADQTIEPLLQIFHDDPSPMIRERAACGLPNPACSVESNASRRCRRCSTTPRMGRSTPTPGNGCFRRCATSRGKRCRTIRQPGGSGTTRGGSGHTAVISFCDGSCRKRAPAGDPRFRTTSREPISIRQAHASQACYAGLRPATADGSTSRPCVRERRRGAIVMLFCTSLMLGMAQAISPTSRLSRF